MDDLVVPPKEPRVAERGVRGEAVVRVDDEELGDQVLGVVGDAPPLGRTPGRSKNPRSRSYR